ncbi:ATP-dependent DNA helicase RecG, domain 3, C-terminal [Dillenia turbinata]|uniref:ATP-dependent DNA helicase RecG, domain 3, C-terminal n=1 Tax=Dillenia turbinata TaxID=194707 RepID=A0AAN8Z2I3_9MAGN
MGYSNLHDQFQNGRTQNECTFGAEDFDPDVSVGCQKFPFISLGSAPLVELYDENMCSEKRASLAAESLNLFLTSSVDSKWVDPDSLCETWSSLYPSFSNVELSTLNGENSPIPPSLPGTVSLENAFKVEESSKLSGPESLNATSIDLILDKSITCIPGLTKKQCRQLESCGFHTLRKLLNHFPRTYGNLQNPQSGIDDGHYSIFLGKILSSRGVKASYSLSFLEIVVCCEFDDCSSGEKKMIYLHLKKFFRGTRFTSHGFLRCLQEKQKEGDIVCVSGKVRAMARKDHFELREYCMDVLESEQDSSLCVKDRPYPLYSSKGGLNPNHLRDIISRVLQSLPVEVDPIPEVICKEFGLMNLYKIKGLAVYNCENKALACHLEAYRGIHMPDYIQEADSARRRLIFDEFFYLQEGNLAIICMVANIEFVGNQRGNYFVVSSPEVKSLDGSWTKVADFEFNAETPLECKHLGRLFQMLSGLGSQIEKEGLLDKYRKPNLNEAYIDEWSIFTRKFLKALPYELTCGQLRAISEIIWDLKQPIPMNRLLQGDVGCGKTVVAFLACMEVIGSGYQAAFMVPTELLAIQHYDHFLNLLENMEDAQFKPSGLLDGDISLVIGTHSLIAESIEFSALRIAVVDEQHRFGVVQRGRFNSKLYYSSSCSKMDSAKSDESSKSDVYMAPHVLAMSATPIPRTLALALYGDISLTHITDLPPGRVPVETHIVEGNDAGFEKVYEMIHRELEDGGKVYLVYPVIELSEQLPQLRAASADLGTISQKFQGYSCGLLHGKLKSDEKEEALRLFRSGETNILLSTQVIEIGVDVPDASLMVVMNAERFGIAQLHQLRGRVGRGLRKSKCMLVASTASSLSRLKVLEKSSDGFHLANVDLLLRGPGDLLGKKQSGHLPEFPIARLEIDGNILQEAHLAALKILSMSHDLEKFPKLKAELSMRQPLSLLGD